MAPFKTINTWQKVYAYNFSQEKRFCRKLSSKTSKLKENASLSQVPKSVSFFLFD